MDILSETLFGSCTVKILRGDITLCSVDAIVNAANSHLQHGGGVAGAIVRRGGTIIQEESDRIGYVPVGESAMTSGGNLKAPFVIHTVGPRWGEGDEETKLRKAIRSTLSLATSRGFRALALPAISSGIFGFPKDRCADIIVQETVRFITEEETTLKEIYFYLMDEDSIRYFVQCFDTMKPI